MKNTNTAQQNMKRLKMTLFSFICLALISSNLAEQPRTKCQWFEYYDDIIDVCSPCVEICKGVLSRGNVIVGTEDQCRQQCSEYLDSKNCTYAEYYDPHIHSCAPCHELCDYSEIRGTTEECTSQCKLYLKAENCTEEQYFNIEESICSPCSNLCYFDKTKGTPKECFDKCSEYVEKNHPGNVMLKRLDLDTGSAVASSSRSPGHPQDSGSAGHPVVYFIVALGIVALIILPVAVYRCRAVKVNRQYVPAPAAVDDPVDSSANFRTPMQPASTLGLTGMEPRTNSADTNFNISMNSIRTQDDGGNIDSNMHVLAPSSSTSQPCPWQSARFLDDV